MNGPQFENPRAEEARLRYLYRSLILRGQIRLPREAALPLVGPDCAYHLYQGAEKPPPWVFSYGFSGTAPSNPHESLCFSSAAIRRPTMGRTQAAFLSSLLWN